MNPPSTPHPFHPQNPNPNSYAPPFSDLSTTLSSLSSLLSLSDHTLHSHSNLINPQNESLVACPFNPHHLMPPESLFLHSLRCPSPLDIDLLNYRQTLKPSADSEQHESLFIQGANSELCISLDDYISHFGSRFFYKDCPGVVDLYGIQNSNKTFTLPGVLSVECADFAGFSEGEIKVGEKEGFRILPSGLWAIRREVEGWRDYPNTYSFNVLCVLLGLKTAKQNSLRRWVLANSPRYGIAIDAYVRDHIVVLFRLCLKAIMREALGLAEVVLMTRDVKEKGSGVNFGSRMFSCSVLIQVLSWLASQLSVLYGQVNGKSFAIDMLRQCIFEGSSQRLLFHMEEKVTECQNLTERSQSFGANGSGGKEVKLEEQLETSRESEPVIKESGTIASEVICVSHVSAAVAALNERSFLEGMIRHLRGSQPLSRYQRMAEHAYASEKADEERRNRPDYRPIIDHDGFPRQISSNQDTSKAKTKEEILAEERDYKRRRMSYRGKKLKRTTLQVMRDIIEEYTEEVKKAGGIGCFVKGAEDVVALPSAGLSASDTGMDVDEIRKSTSDISETKRVRDSPDHYRKRSRNDYDTRSTTLGDASHKSYDQSRENHHEYHDHPEDARRSVDSEKRRKEHQSRSSKRHRSHSQSDEWISRGREKVDVESSRSKHYENRRSSSRASKYHDVHVPKNDGKLEVKDRNQKSLYKQYTSDSQAQTGFEDRYDPSKSHNINESENEPLMGSQYIRPE